jgi:hypothetical protein
MSAPSWESIPRGPLRVEPDVSAAIRNSDGIASVGTLVHLTRPSDLLLAVPEQTFDDGG